MFDSVRGFVRMLAGTVARTLRATEQEAGHSALCLAWPAIYARTWVYWWRLVVLLLLLAMIEAMTMLAHLTG